MSKTVGQYYLDNVIKNFRSLKALADKAIAQVDDEAFFLRLDPESNSIGLVVKHMAGNMRSRWTDFLTSDGEKPDRNRDSEFEEQSEDRATLMAKWEAGWKYVFDALEPLTEDDLLHTVTIRDEPHTVIDAINRQISHYGYHVGQIVFVAKHLKSADWQTLSIARNRSSAFNETMRQRHGN